MTNVVAGARPVLHMRRFVSAVLVIALLPMFAGAWHAPSVAVSAQPEGQSIGVAPMVAAGGYHTVGLRSDGTVVAVGHNIWGELDTSSWQGITAIAAGHGHTVGLKSDGTVVGVGSNWYGQLETSGWTDITAIAAGADHTVGLKSDGTVVAVGSSISGQLVTSTWTDIIAIAAGNRGTVGLKSDGTVVATGFYNPTPAGWTDIVAIAAGDFHIVGLKSDGTVVGIVRIAGIDYGQVATSAWTDITAIAAGTNHTVGLKSDGTVVAIGDTSYGKLDTSTWKGVTAVAAGHNHTVGLKSDGAVVASGANSLGQLQTSAWNDIRAVAAGAYHTVGLRSDGTVAAVGSNSSGQLATTGWTDITAIAAAYDHTVGLKSDGTVVGVGNNGYGQLEISAWTGITAIAVGTYHTIGLKSDGTVVGAGSNGFGQLETSTWTDIIAIACGGLHTVGLKSDGTVVAVGRNSFGQITTSAWTDITAIAGGIYHTVGLKSDGTVDAAGTIFGDHWWTSTWTDIIAVTGGYYHTVGLKSDGTVVAVGSMDYGQLATSGWTDIIAVTAGTIHTVGLRADGTIVAVGDNESGQYSVWFDLADPPPNTPPVAVCDSYAKPDDGALSVPAPGFLENDTDADGDTLRALKTSDPPHGALTVRADGSFVYTPDEGFAGEDNFTYQAYDGVDYSDTTTVTITVHAADPPPDPDPVIPVAGDDRYLTAVKTSELAFPEGADTVVIATGENWPDALGGTSLAGALDGPVLLVKKGSVPSAVRKEIRRLKASNAIILGGEGAVGTAVEGALKTELGEKMVRRVWGNDRYMTANAIAREVIKARGAEFDGYAFVATSVDFPDALAAAPLAAAKGWPLFLANPKTGLSAATKTAMDGVEKTLILGGTAVVSPETQTYLNGRFGKGDVKRLAGGDRYETAAVIAAYAVKAHTHRWNRVGITTGENFPDALAGGVLQGKEGSVMLLTRAKALSAPARDALILNKDDIFTVTFFGGDSAVSAAVRTAVGNALE